MGDDWYDQDDMRYFVDVEGGAFIGDNGGDCYVMCHDCCVRNFEGGNGGIDYISGIAPSIAECDCCGD